MKLELSRNAGQLVSGEYGWSISGTAVPEPPQRDPAANRITRSQLVKELFGTDAALDEGSRFGFPNAVMRSAKTGEPIWHRDRVQQWHADLKSFAEKLK